ILNPERIVAGGVYMRSGKWMQEGIRRTLEAEALCPVPVAPAQLGEKIGDVAALTVAAYGLAQGKE
ncbi:MAG: ROK family protein, partial [Christensenellaceae bacterium]